MHNTPPFPIRSLLAAEEYHVDPGASFGEKSYRDAEVITLVIEGELEHNDGFNNGSVIFPGDVHRMTAGRGVTRTESNGSESEPLRFVRLTIAPARQGLTPGYEQRAYLDFEKEGRLLLVASGDGREQLVTIHQDADLYMALLAAGEEVAHMPAAGRMAWLQVVRGRVTVNGEEIVAGCVSVTEGNEGVRACAVEAAVILLLDVA